MENLTPLGICFIVNGGHIFRRCVILIIMLNKMGLDKNLWELLFSHDFLLIHPYCIRLDFLDTLKS
ncbi:hypothetical protein SADUNF_Sadunf18G0050000 [Salix dunnii]|uniref:Uncharacterized protein n=1 Tax=Salix dunnii TaxID=1413687 RepID=A0A835MIR9_9ROSI|nr:hypothetical protein SADUNF_Sadunf18G0050000 [Salix dunnii]